MMLMPLAMMPNLLAVVPDSGITHTTVKAGLASDPTVYDTGTLPVDGSRVHVIHNLVYDLNDATPARIDWIKVGDGTATPVTFEFATGQNTKLHVETFVVDLGSTIKCGTEANPLEEQYTAHTTFIDTGLLDHTVDVELQGRGLIVLGDSELYGAFKTTWDYVSEHPKIGDTSITFAEAPVGWKIGGRMLIGGTFFNPENTGPHAVGDEARVITGFADDGRTVFFADALIHDHTVDQFQHPDVSWDLHVPVQYKDRNIIFESENDGKNGSDLIEFPWLRGHTMFMHNPATDIRYVQFEQLGRTEKRHAWSSAGNITTGGPYDVNRALNWFEFDDPASPYADVIPPKSGASNVKGRYSLHLHKHGVASLEPEAQAFVIGCAVNGSPGWGYAQHDSNTMLYRNTLCDVSGAGMMAETANERGGWIDNCGMNCQAEQARTAKLSENINEGWDWGRAGEAFRLGSRQVRMVGNVATGCNNGFSWFHRGRVEVLPLDGKINILAENIDIPDMLGNDGEHKITVHPILHAERNVAIGCNIGLLVEKADPGQGSAVRTVFLDFWCYSCRVGIEWNYTGHYSADGFLFLGRRPAIGASNYGFLAGGANTIDLAFVNSHVERSERVGGLDNKTTTSSLYNEGQTWRRHAVGNVTHHDISVELWVENSHKDNNFPGGDPHIQTPLLDRFQFTYKTTPVRAGNVVGTVLTHQGFQCYEYSNGTMYYDIAKADSLASHESTSPIEKLGISPTGMQALIRDLGYWTEVGTGDKWFMCPLYIDDAGGGANGARIFQHKVVLPIRVTANLNHSNYAGAVDHGLIDFTVAEDTSNMVLSGNPFPPNRGRCTKTGPNTFDYSPDPGSKGLVDIVVFRTNGQRTMVRETVTVDTEAVAWPNSFSVDLEAPSVVEVVPAEITINILEEE